MGARRKYMALMDPAKARDVFGKEYKCLFTKADEPMLFAIMTALDKQIPTVYRLDHDGLPICPNCAGYVSAGWEHCKECGQRLKSPEVGM